MRIGKLAYFAYIFSRLNDCNGSLQGYCINRFTVCNKLLKKVIFSNRCLQKSDIDMFPSLQDFMASTYVDTKELVVIMSQYLKGKPLIFAYIFPKIRS